MDTSTQTDTISNVTTYLMSCITSSMKYVGYGYEQVDWLLEAFCNEYHEPDEDKVKSWFSTYLKTEIKTDFLLRISIVNSIDWDEIEEYIQHELDVLDIRTETCVKCNETKTASYDEWYYNTTPVKNAPVCDMCIQEA